MYGIEEKIKQYGFSEDLSNKVRHSVSVLRKSEEFALRFYDKGFRNYPLWACYSFVSHECTYWIAGIKNTLLFLSINGIHD